ncbi:PREDICTED: uncharacterized protein LOC106810213 [Priapulus caudatus]|uniref:Uncharacterized protein LOC106810213 n=1 Tax=Priapulus caudatus TaxID=37621 RepID=A0ABM1E9W2_PRICU|nr:PREDICTED: uncharacterized protein LOC106810213 [Priapulus caudatus]
MQAFRESLTTVATTFLGQSANTTTKQMPTSTTAAKGRPNTVVPSSSPVNGTGGKGTPMAETASSSPDAPNSVKGNASSVPNGKAPSGSSGLNISGIDVACNSYEGNMTITVNFTASFNGNLFIKGFFDDCIVSGNDTSNSTSITIPLDSCGTQQTTSTNTSTGESIKYENTLMVMFNRELGILQASDKAYQASCEFVRKEKSVVNGSITLPPLTTTQLPVVKYEAEPDVELLVFSGTDQFSSPSNGLLVGEGGTLAIILKDNSQYDLAVTDCFAHDGAGRSELKLIDENGCPANGNLVSPLRKLRDTPAAGQTAVVTTFQAFKFPDQDSVYFRCMAKTCAGKCEEVRNHQCRS